MNSFTPANCPFEILGYFEEFHDTETCKFLGTRKIEEPDREVGSGGMKIYTLTEPLDLEYGWKKTPVKVKASKKSPRQVTGIIQMLTGKLKNLK